MKKDRELDKDELERLEELQKYGRKGVGKKFIGKLSYPDLQLLLCADPVIKNLIQQIVIPMLEQSDGKGALSDSSEDGDHSVQKHQEKAFLTPVVEYRDRIVEKEVVKYQDREVEKRVEVPVDGPLLTALAPELKLLKAIKADADLMPLWLWADESEGRQLVRLLATLSDWEQVLRLWGRLAERCKTGKRAANSAELAILNAALALHNLRYRDRSAELQTVAQGSSFNHETMERGSPKGNTVADVWLPGLTNAAGQVQKKPLVNLE